MSEEKTVEQTQEERVALLEKKGRGAYGPLRKHFAENQSPAPSKTWWCSEEALATASAMT